MSLQVANTDDGIAVLTLDDGARNALDPERFRELQTAFDEAEEDVRAFVVTGREGVLTAGLDLKYMAASDADGIRDLLVLFGQVMMRIWTEPRPTVCAATGHALAAGTMLAMACDHAIAAEGEFAWGLTETQINFAMPAFGLALARHNVRNDRIDDLVLPGTRVDPVTAVDVGYADELVPPEQAREAGLAAARGLAELPAQAYGATKGRLRGAAAEACLAGLEADIDDMRDFFGD